MIRDECEAIRPLISAALDGELDEEEFVRLSEHLASCSQCRQVHRDYYQLRDDFRSVETPAPPPDVSRTILQETIEKPPPSAVVRFVSRAGLRFGMSAAAASVVILIVIALLGFHSHQQRVHPAVAGSEPALESSQTWPIHQPVKIHFSKQMNQESVLENLTIYPFTEHERLPTMWDGNTLIIGRSEDRSVLLQPETDYMITIRPQAEDVHGNAMGDFWTLIFRTGPADVAVSTPTADREQTDQETPDAQESDVDPNEAGEHESTEPAPSPTSGSSGTGSGGQGDAPAGSPEDTSGSGSNGSQSSGSGDQLPPDSSETTPTPPSDVTVTPEPSPTTPVATPTPEPAPTNTPQPTPSPTAEPTPPPSPDPIPVRGAFGEVYWASESIQQRLGAPTQPEVVFLASEQEFQRGLMFHRVNTSGLSIYVFANDGGVRNYPDTWSTEDGEFHGETPSEDLYVPQASFGKIWAENPDEVASQLGFALSAAPVSNIEARMQQFNSGQMIYSRGMVYVIYSDSTWERFVDGGPSGFQSGSDMNGAGQDSQTDQETEDDPRGVDSVEPGHDETDSSENPENGTPTPD